MDYSNTIQSIGIFLAIIGLIITIIFNLRQLKINNKQLKLSLFAEYTRRYQDIILNLPENIHLQDFDFKKLTAEERSKTLKYIRVYFDLCSEEYDLFKSGCVEKRVWENWKEGIEFAFSRPAFREAWYLIQFDSKYYPEFTKFVKELLEKLKV